MPPTSVRALFGAIAFGTCIGAANPMVQNSSGRGDAARQFGIAVKQRRGNERRFDRQVQLVQVRQVIEVVRGDGGLGQAIDSHHQRPVGNLRAIGWFGPFDEADRGLGADQGIGERLLGQPLLNTPLAKLHFSPPGPNWKPLYCHRLYSVAIDKQTTGVDYNKMQSNVFVMRPGNRLRDLRKAAGITQAEMAEKTGVSQPAISQIENGVLSIDIQWLRAFARALGCTPADILDDDDNPDRLSDDERALLARFRAANPGQRATLERVAAAVVPLAGEDETSADAVA